MIMNNKLNIISLILIFFFVTTKYIVTPYFTKRSATRIVKIILEAWSSDDYLEGIKYWEDENKYPPVYGLKNYKIRNRQFIKEKKKNKKVSILVDLKFDKDNLLPSNSQWQFIFEDTRYGWKVIQFKVSRLHPSDYRKNQGRYDPDKDYRMLRQFEEEAQQKDALKNTPSQAPRTITLPEIDLTSEGARPGYKTIPASTH